MERGDQPDQPRRGPARGRLSAALATAAAVVTLAGCGSGHSAAARPSAPPTTAPPTTAPPTTAAPVTAAPAPTTAPAGTVLTLPSETTTTAPAPFTATAPQSSPDAAAARLVDLWSEGARAQAASVATPDAVSTLFAIAYPAGYIQDRGCTDSSVSPGVCTYRNTDDDGIYEIGVTQGPKGWYVSSVTPEQ